MMYEYKSGNKKETFHYSLGSNSAKKRQTKNSSSAKKKKKDKSLWQLSGSQQKNPFTKSLKGYQPSEEIKKLLDAPLNTSQDYPGHYALKPPRSDSDKISKNALPKTKRNSSSKKEQKRRVRQQQRSFLLDRSIPYSERCYSDRLELEKQYLTKTLTPISKTFKDSMLIAAELQTLIQSSLQSFQQTLQEARCEFLRLQPAVDSVLRQDTKAGNNAKVSPFLKLNVLSQNCEANTPKTISQLLENGSYLLDSSDESVMLSHRMDGIASEDVIYYEKLAEIGEREFFPGQLEAIKSILSKQSCLCRATKPTEKSTLYKLPALLCQGLIVYVSSSINFMTDQIQKLPASIFAACYNNLISSEKAKQMQELVKSGEVKILFITIERLLNDHKFQMPNVTFVVFDEPHCCYDLSTNYKLSHKNFHIVLRKKFKSAPLLAIVPLITTEEAVGVSQMFDIEARYIFPAVLAHQIRPSLTISCDKEPHRALVWLLKTADFAKKTSSVLLYVEGRKSAEELSSVLAKEDISHQIYSASKTEIQKLQLINHFFQQNYDVLIIPSGLETGIDRSLVKRTIHYNLPKSAEILIQEILCLGEEAHSHIFLNDSDYYKTKAGIFADTIDSGQVSQFIDILMETQQNSSEIQQKCSEQTIQSGSKRRRDGTLINSKLPSNGEQVIGPESHKPSMHSPTQQDGEIDKKGSATCKIGTYSIKVSEMMRRLNLRKDHMLLLFEMFETTGNWLKFLGVNPLLCSIQLFQENFPVNGNSNLVLDHLMSKARKPRSHVKIQLPELASELNATPNDVLKALKNLQNEEALKIDILEETLNFRVKIEARRFAIEEQISRITTYLSKKAEMAYRKLDAVWAIAKDASLPSVEEAWSHQKRNQVNRSVKRKTWVISNEQEESNKLDELPQSLKIFEWFDQYLNLCDTADGLTKLFKDPNGVRLLLPTARNMSDQKDLLAVLSEFLSEYIDRLSTQDSQFLDPKAYESEQVRAQISRNITRIGMGMPCFDLDQDCKS